MSEIVQQKYELVPVDKLTPHPDNPNQGDIGEISVSIERNGFFGAVLVQKSSGRILAGEHRWRAAQEDGLAKVPVIWVDVDDVTARRILLVDNRAAELASRDENALAALLKTIAEQEGTEGLLGTGYDGDFLDELLSEFNEDGNTEPQLGDVGYRIIVTCDSEQHQAELLARFEDEGLNVQAIAQ